MSTSHPIDQLTHRIKRASELPLMNSSFDEPAVADPLARLERRLQSGMRAASFSPPLTGIVADIEAAQHLYDHPVISADTSYDVFDVLKPKPVPKPAASVMLKPSLPVKKPKPVAPAAAPVSSGGVIASVMLDAIARRALPGEARAEAAHLLAQGLALGDESLMQEALSVLITGASS